MSNKVITMQQVRSVIQYLEKGYSLRAITRQMGLSRKTVTIYAQRLQHIMPRAAAASRRPPDGFYQPCRLFYSGTKTHRRYPPVGVAGVSQRVF